MAVSNDTIYSSLFDTIYKSPVKNPSLQKFVFLKDRLFFIWNLSLYNKDELLVGGIGDDRFNGGLLLFNTKRNTFHRFPVPQNKTTINAVYFDKESGITWMGRDNGLTAYFNSPFQVFEMPESETISSIGLAGDSLLILTGRGICYLHKGTTDLLLSENQIKEKLKEEITRFRRQLNFSRKRFN